MSTLAGHALALVGCRPPTFPCATPHRSVRPGLLRLAFVDTGIGDDMESESINALYEELSLLKAKLNGARIEYQAALNLSDRIAATEALKRWDFIELELERIASQCDRRRVKRQP